MSERINEKQAVGVAEWVGVENHYFANTDKIDGVIFNGNLLWDKDDTQYFWGTISNWLYSAEGQEALMDKLGQKILGIEFGYCCIKKISHKSVIITHYDRGVDWRANAKTRQHALLLAILEMIKDEK